MGREWTFGRKIGAGFAAVAALTLVMAIAAAYAINAVVESKDRVIETHAADMADAERLGRYIEKHVSAARGYMIAAEPRFEESMRRARGESIAILEQMKQRASGKGEKLLDAIGISIEANASAVAETIAIRKAEGLSAEVERHFETRVMPTRDDLDTELREYIEISNAGLIDGKEQSNKTAASAIYLLILVAGVVVLAAVFLAFMLTRTLTQQVGNAVGQVQSSSAELQAAANQQASGAKEQTTAMNEIATTISELLATSRQIAESAQRVAGIAGETTDSTDTGQNTVDRTQEAIAEIRRQVDVIVNHMLELGKKSQQIGSVLDIVSELAEQTNILAVNATIEAAGAGESGRRFSVVAEEIRKLADRVSGSTKEIRNLIDEVRSAVNATVMTTETGSKAVEAGARHFADVKTSFSRIAELISTTMEAAREIELSTKQQATAVEQVNVAISNVAQATKETETSSTQTLQTASQLTTLSRDLLRLIQPEAIA